MVLLEMTRKPNDPTPLAGVTSDDVARTALEVLERATRLQTTRLPLGDAPLTAAEAPRLLGALESLTDRYDFSLEVCLDAPLPRALVARLRGAGVRRVRIAAPLKVRSGSARAIPAAADLATLCGLAEQHIEIHWEIAVDDVALLTSPLAFSDLWHLPPPQAIRSGASPVPADVLALSAWRRANSPALLTYTRGPGFIRIIDRRTTGATQRGGGRERLLVVHGLGAAVFELCRGDRSAADIAARLADRAQPGSVEHALDAFERSRIVVSDAEGVRLALPLWWRALGVE